MKPLVPVAAALAVLTASAPGRADAPRIIPHDATEDVRQCPPPMRGASLVLRPLTGGVAIDVTTPRRQLVPALREQLRDIALVVEMHSKTPVHMAASDDDAPAVRIPPLDISVNDVGAGARVIIRTQRARDLPELLELARALQLFWERSDCNDDYRARSLRALPSQRA